MGNEGRCHEQSDADPAQDCAERTRNPDKQTDRESDLQDPDKIAQPIRQPVLFEFLNDVGIAHAPDKEDRRRHERLQKNSQYLHTRRLPNPSAI